MAVAKPLRPVKGLYSQLIKENLRSRCTNKKKVALNWTGVVVTGCSKSTVNYLSSARLLIHGGQGDTSMTNECVRQQHT